MTTVLVLALNPSIDVEWKVDRVEWEEKNSVASTRRWAGGKGINVARWLSHLKVSATVLLPVGGPTGAELLSYLKRDRIPFRQFSLDGSTRENVIVTTATQGQLRFNPPGPTFTRNQREELRQTVLGLVDNKTRFVVLSGSIPPGLSTSFVRKLLNELRERGVSLIVDCDGEMLTAAAQARPFLVKPNAHELGRWAGQKLSSTHALVSAARKLSKVTGGWVFVSRGGDGGLLVNLAEGVELEGRVPSVDVINTVGSGDALLAATVAAMVPDQKPEVWLGHGLAAGTASTSFPAGKLPSLKSIQLLRKKIRITGC